ncbi:EAL domain-containing protein [Pseudomonas sp. CFBP 8770]|uniref:sensor domain-containing phosphodiesterase n=1 Tax=unclassified Pseudomonas TaxID=196821 RepID=UPI001783067D|nr:MULTISPECIES: EAL domain-containing protein [unclassified Pseudomonas]MBD8472814.1 EAL domain-containing protein [Pseudomonas sp. CFBP 8773]MBD8646083.1 EAL domain-containing protein [Pseudomonas sp. CFBP 8770]
MTANNLMDLVALKPLSANEAGCVDRVLRAMRTHLGMDVAFVSHFRQTDRVFTHVDAAALIPLSPGDVLEMSAGYCRGVVSGELPGLIRDTGRLPAAMAIPQTPGLPIGAHMSVPIHLSDGRLYGTFCCFSHAPDPGLTERDLKMMKVFAELIAERLESDLQMVRDHDDKALRVLEAIESDQPRVVYQPIYDLHTMHVAGWECLSRFNGQPARTPDVWFKEAAEVGLGKELECLAIAVALAGLAQLAPGTYLSINCSPELVLSGRLLGLFENYPAERLVLEITEHAVVQDYASLQVALQPLRLRGVRVAIDDAGAGYASMRHILQVRPDIIKLDMSLTRGIDQDFQRRAMASALIAFARETGSVIIAEGVETEAELAQLKRLGAANAQGFLLGRPEPL